MKIVTKKTTGLFLLLPAITPLLFIAWFSIQKQIIRHRMKEHLERQLLQSVSMADDEINWAEEGKEIWIKGQLFDIDNIEHRNGTTIFTGLYDEDETMLIKQVDETSKKNLPGDNQFFVQLFKCFQNIFYDQSSSSYFLFDKQGHLLSSAFPKLMNQFRAITTPPPRVGAELFY